MNPSTEDILKEIERTPAEIVYVLPNNKNIIMAAEQCVSLCEDKTVSYTHLDVYKRQGQQGGQNSA